MGCTSGMQSYNGMQSTNLRIEFERIIWKAHFSIKTFSKTFISLCGVLTGRIYFDGWHIYFDGRICFLMSCIYFDGLGSIPRDCNVTPDNEKFIKENVCHGFCNVVCPWSGFQTIFG